MGCSTGCKGHLGCIKVPENACCDVSFLLTKSEIRSTCEYFDCIAVALSLTVQAGEVTSEGREVHSPRQRSLDK